MTDAAFFILSQNYLRSSNFVQNQHENISVNFLLLSYYGVNQCQTRQNSDSVLIIRNEIGISDVSACEKM